MSLGNQARADMLDLLLGLYPNLYAEPRTAHAGVEGQTGAVATNATVLTVPAASFSAATIADPAVLANGVALLWPTQSGALTGCGYVALWTHPTNRTAADYLGTATIVDGGGSPTTVTVPDGIQLRFQPGELRILAPSGL